MVSLFCNSIIPPRADRKCSAAQAARAVLFGVAWCITAALGLGQSPPVHDRHTGEMPPGAIGCRQLGRGGPLHGYFQPVEIQAPVGVWISAASAGAFEEGTPAPLTVGLLVGATYRFRVSAIPRNEGLELFPTIEVVDRLSPPPGRKVEFPIPVELTLEELEMALAGKMVTRIVYLENPRFALPVASANQPQRYFEVGAGEDPVQAAAQLGRPVAILRMGARVPGPTGPDDVFLFGSPMLERYSDAGETAPQTTALISRPRAPGLQPQPISPPPALFGQPVFSR